MAKKVYFLITLGGQFYVKKSGSAFQWAGNNAWARFGYSQSCKSWPKYAFWNNQRV